MRTQRILLVDDEAAFTRVLKSYLEKTGVYEVRMENVAERALEAAIEFQPDLILLDVIMPGLDGSRVAAQIKADGRIDPKTPIIFLTAVVSREEAHARQGTIGDQVFIAKPVSIQEILGCIESRLGPSGHSTPGPQAAADSSHRSSMTSGP